MIAHAMGTDLWIDVCAFDQLIPDRGVCALVGDEQVAVFRIAPHDNLYAVSNYDPFSDAYVMSRGIVGSHDESPKVASPMHKQCFDLATGGCLDDPEVALTTYRVRVVDGRVQVAA